MLLCLLALALPLFSQAFQPSSYLGCFDVRDLPTFNQERWAWSADNCRDVCEGLEHSLYGLGKLRHYTSCWCGSEIPSPSQALTSGDCNRPFLVALFYNNKANDYACVIEEIPFRRDTVQAAYGAENAEFFSNGTMKLTVNGVGYGVRVTVPTDRLYGMYQVKALTSSSPGVVTAFYVRSDYNQETSDFTEIDVEWLNGSPGTTNTVFFNSFTDGKTYGEHIFDPDYYQGRIPLEEGSTSANTWLTYTFNWQSDHVVWAINGVPHVCKYDGQFYSWYDMKKAYYEEWYKPPNKASHATFSIWSDTSSLGFGGRVPSDQKNDKFSSFFDSHRRITCTQDMPGTPLPTWFY